MQNEENPQSAVGSLEYVEVRPGEEETSEQVTPSPTPTPSPTAPQDDNSQKINPDQIYMLFGPGLEQNVKRSEGAWYHPISKFTLSLLQDSQFRVAAADLYSKFDRGTFVGFEIAWVIIIWILRTWRLSKAQTWLARIWVSIWVSLLFSTGIILIIPWILWGNPILTVMKSFFKVLMNQILA